MRVRFAPSPTGFLHIGNARTALSNYIQSVKHGADYVLRIEDTDKERSSRESEESILQDLKWLGIEWTEGPDMGGEKGPYRQSERYDIYQEYTDKLIAEKKAYHCYCSKEDLDRQRKEAEEQGKAFTYPGTCRHLTEEEKKEKEAQGIQPVVRFMVPEGETIVVNDLIKGEVTFSSENIGGDFIIVRSDGNPIYNYIVTIDDTLMGITHVIRGEDHLSNTPKQILVARALGLPEPSYAHHSLILGPDKSKLSKRHGITSVAMYRDQGYLPEALRNYMGLLGWAMDDDQEIVDFETLTRAFDLTNLGKSSPVFDFEKLKWVNSQYIKKLSPEKAVELFTPYLEKEGFDLSTQGEELPMVIDLLKGYCSILSDIGSLAGIFLHKVNEPDEKTADLLGKEGSRELIAAAQTLVSSTIDESNFLTDLVPAIKEATGLKGKHLFHPFRAMVTGRLNGPDMDLALPIIGFTRVKERIEYAHKRFCR